MTTREPDLEELILPSRAEREDPGISGPYIVILYNDDYHGMDEVVMQVQKATGYDIDRCVMIMAEAHTAGRAVSYSGSQEDCERCAGILRQIRLQVETDRA